jgi:radical SAM superfamily enzyme YgiQ (UPF0313 family)
MKALLINPEFPSPSYWTMREVCTNTGTKTLLPPLGLITVAALLPPDWELRLVDLNTRRITDEDWQWADLVLFTAMIVQQDTVCELIREAKKRGKTVVTGGPYPTSMPEPIIEAGSDFLVRGEGENTIPMFLEAFREGAGSGIFMSDERPDITASPKPRFDLLDFRSYAAAGIQTSRGCPFDCEFCDIVNLYGRRVRYKTPDQVIEELEELYRLGWKGITFVSDDNFIGSGKRAREILTRLIPWHKSHGEPFDFWTQTSTNLGRDREMIDLMTAANFAYVFVGIETPDEEVLARNRKYQNIGSPLVESVKSINRNGLSLMGSFVIGFDGEQKGAGERIRDFVEETAIPTVMLNILQAVPNTRLWDRLSAEGRLLEEKTTGQTTGGSLNYIPTRPEKEIMQEFADAWDYLYEPSHFLARAYRYYLNMRPQRSASGLETENAPHEGGASLIERFRAALSKIRSFVHLIGWYGFRPGIAGQFWGQLLGMRRKNPSRVVAYLNACALGVSMIRLRSDIRSGVHTSGQEDQSDLSSEVRPASARISTRGAMKL